MGPSQNLSRELTTAGLLLSIIAVVMFSNNIFVKVVIGNEKFINPKMLKTQILNQPGYPSVITNS